LARWLDASEIFKGTLIPRQKVWFVTLRTFSISRRFKKVMGIRPLPTGLAFAVFLVGIPTAVSDSSWRNLKSQTVPLEYASPDGFIHNFQMLFKGYGLSVQPAPQAKAIVLTGPQDQRRFGLGWKLISAMDVDDRFLETLRTRAEQYDYARTYTLSQLVDRVDRFLECEKALERMRRWTRQPVPPRSMQGCGGQAWADWYSKYLPAGE
jgi:hypothetical protein